MMGRERNGLLACLFALLCAFALPQPQAEATGRVEAVAAHVTASEGLPPLVQQRMERSVQVIAEQLLLGMPADSSDADAAAQSEVIRQVFDKVLVGYTVRGVNLRLGDTADVTVELMPWSDQIRTISVETSVEGMPPEVERLVRQDLADVGSVFSACQSQRPTGRTVSSSITSKRTSRATCRSFAATSRSTPRAAARRSA